MSSAHIVRGAAFGLFFDPSRYEELRAAIADDTGIAFNGIFDALVFLGFVLRDRALPVEVINDISISVAEFENNLKLLAPYVEGEARFSMVLINSKPKEYRMFGGKVYRMKPIDLWELDCAV